MELPKMDDRFKPSPSSKRKGRWEPKELFLRHKELLRLLVLGYTTGQVSKIMKVSKETVMSVKKSPLGQQYIDYLSARRDEAVLSVREKFEELAPTAVDTLGEAMEQREDIRARIIAADKILNYAGYEPPKKHLVQHVTKDTIEQIKDRARRRNAEYAGEEVEDAKFKEE